MSVSALWRAAPLSVACGLAFNAAAAEVKLPAEGRMVPPAALSDDPNAPSDPAFGYWLVESERAIIEIGACASDVQQACGRIAWMIEPLDENGDIKRDKHNPDVTLRSQPLCGLMLISELTREDVGAWEDGRIYDASSGDHYGALVEVRSESELKVRGFAGISLFGRSQIWRRQADNRGGCGVPLHGGGEDAAEEAAQAASQATAAEDGVVE